MASSNRNRARFNPFSLLHAMLRMAVDFAPAAGGRRPGALSAPGQRSRKLQGGPTLPQW